MACRAHSRGDCNGKERSASIHCETCVIGGPAARPRPPPQAQSEPIRQGPTPTLRIPASPSGAGAALTPSLQGAERFGWESGRRVAAVVLVAVGVTFALNLPPDSDLRAVAPEVTAPPPSGRSTGIVALARDAGTGPMASHCPARGSMLVNGSTVYW